jgi:hypothetical protein
MIWLLHPIYKRLNLLIQGVTEQKPYKSFTKPVLSNSHANRHIKLLIEEGKPFMLSRFGAVELSCIINYLSIAASRNSFWEKAQLQIEQGKSGYWSGWLDYVRSEISKNAGVFPASDQILEKFSRFMLSKIKDIDVLAVWNLYGESKMQKEYCSQSILVPLESIEPYYHEDPWSKSLAGKKVLVIHPFEQSIKANYKNRDKLFVNEVLPEFELKTIKAVQSLADNNTDFDDWFDAYHHMCAKIAAVHFDIAIIGAGAYGLPLAAFIKEIGKQAIHMGGPTQILFGIKGARWDNRPFFQNLYNSYWTRPLPSEVPQNFKAVEQGCYW